MLDLDIDTLVPHRLPMRLIDEILSVCEEFAETAAVVTPDWPTVVNGAAHVVVLIELVAQTAAVIGGLQSAASCPSGPSHKGLLVGIRQADFTTDDLPVGTRIITRATTRPLLDNFKEITGVARVDGRIVGEMALQGVQMA
jgi:predicted hotdog family 3-hydroxylacyl-ACP dehydratase